MSTRKVLYADEGKVLTNGQIYGKRIYLGKGMSEDGFYQISFEQYKQKISEDPDTGCGGERSE